MTNKPLLNHEQISRSKAKLIPIERWTEARHDPPKPLSTLRRWCRDGHIPGAQRTGREWRVPADAEYTKSSNQQAANDVESFIYGRKTSSKAA